jgi:hypothetical protein
MEILSLILVYLEIALFGGPTRLSKNLILDLRQVQVLHKLISRLKLYFARFYTFSTVSTAGVTGKRGNWRSKPPDAESAAGAASPKVRAKPRTCPVHAVLGALFRVSFLKFF